MRSRGVYLRRNNGKSKFTVKVEGKEGCGDRIYRIENLESLD